MKNIFKIILILLAVAPMWLTIVALAEENPTEAWRDRINKKLLQIESPKIQIVELVQIKDPLKKKDLKRDFDLDLSGLSRRGISGLALKFYDEMGRLENRIELRARLDIQRHVPVAKYPLSRGEVIEAKDLDFEWREVSSFRGSLPANVVGRRARTTIRSGAVVTDNLLQKDLLIRKGERVRIKVNSSGLNLSMVGVAKESGIMGQTIRILNPNSQKTVFATVTGKQRAEVDL